jgi:hypothetical protein
VELYVRCECGWECIATREDLIRQVRAHGVAIHAIELTDEQAFAAARPYVTRPQVSGPEPKSESST